MRNWRWSSHILVLCLAATLAAPVRADQDQTSSASPAVPNAATASTSAVDFKEIIKGALSGQATQLLVEETQAEVHSRVEPVLTAFKKKYPILEMQPERNPLLRELIAGAVQKSMLDNFAQIYRRVYDKTKARYESQTIAISPEVRAQVLQIFPEVMSELNTPQGRSEIAARTVLMIQLQFANEVNKSVVAVADSDKKQESGLPILVDQGPGHQQLPGYIFQATDTEDQVRNDSPESVRRNFVHGLAGATVEFGRQSTFFNIPVGLIALSELGMEYSKDPLAFDKFLHSLTDPAAQLSFAAFMATNHKLTQALSGVMTGTIPRQLLPYIGMSAGLIASSLFSDLWNDKDIRACARSYIGAAKEAGRCERAYDNWVPSKKIDAYMPSIISLSASTLASSVVQGAARFAVNAPKLMWTYRLGGLRMTAATGRLVLTGSATGGPLGFIAANAVFLVADKILYAPIDDWWKRTSIESMDLSAALSDSIILGNAEKAVRVLLFHKISMPNQDVTTMVDAHSNFEAALKNYDQTGWDYKKLETCLPVGFAVVDLFNIPLVSRRTEIKSCLIQRDMLTNMQNLTNVHVKWRQYLLRNVYTSAESWVQSVANFTMMFNASTALYKKMIDGLHAKILGRDKVGDENVDLGFYSFAKLLNKTTGLKAKGLQSEQEKENSATLFSDHVGGFRTPELVDYIIHSMACGPDMNANPTLWQKVRSFSWAPLTLLNRALPWVFKTADLPAPTNQMIDTPYGQKFRFYPPSILKVPGEICQVYNYDYAPGTYRVDIPDENGFRPNHDYWTDLPFKNETYHGIIDYIIRNADPKLIGSLERSSLFDLWWDEKVVEPSSEVWETFRTDYTGFLQRNLLPLVQEKPTRGACLSPDVSCVFSKDTPTIGDDLVSSFLVELDYHRELQRSILQSLVHSSRGPTKEVADNIAVRKELASRFDQFANVFKAGLNVTEDQFKQKEGERILTGIVERLGQELDLAKVDESDYRRTVLTQSSKQLVALLGERARLQQFLGILVFANRDDQKITGAGMKTSADPRARY